MGRTWCRLGRLLVAWAGEKYVVLYHPLPADFFFPPVAKCKKKQKTKTKKLKTLMHQQRQRAKQKSKQHKLRGIAKQLQLELDHYTKQRSHQYHRHDAPTTAETIFPTFSSGNYTQHDDLCIFILPVGYHTGASIITTSSYQTLNIVANE